jgi:hypothetical protein
VVDDPLPPSIPQFPDDLPREDHHRKQDLICTEESHCGDWMIPHGILPHAYCNGWRVPATITYPTMRAANLPLPVIDHDPTA